MVITYYNRLSATNIYKIIGENILYLKFKLDYNKSLNYNKKIYKDKFNLEEFIEKNNWLKFKIENNINDISYIHLGKIFFGYFEMSEIFLTTLESEEYKANEYSGLNKIIINPIYINYFKNNLIIKANNLPMICQPAQWDDNNFGGFLENKIQKK